MVITPKRNRDQLLINQRQHLTSAKLPIVKGTGFIVLQRIPYWTVTGKRGHPTETNAEKKYKYYILGGYL